MHIPKLASIITVCRAILAGDQVKLNVNINVVKKVKVEPAPPYIPVATQYQAELTVHTSRHGRTRWTHVPMAIPAGNYIVIFNSVIGSK